VNFAERLAGLPATDHLAGIDLSGPDGANARLDNVPGSQGSVRVYAYLLDRHGVLDAAAAAEGLALYAEHAADARAHPGKHPNIDRLLAIAAGGGSWQGRLKKIPEPNS
jgi:hypothetical protein